MIGDGGLALVGQFARRRGSGSGKPGGAIKITGAAQDPTTRRWTYTVLVGGMFPKPVAGDDDAWELHAAPQASPAELRARAAISARLARPAVGQVEGWVRDDEKAAEAISACVKMDSTAETGGALQYLWTAGAADCVAVAAYCAADGGRAVLEHATRSSCGNAAAFANTAGLGGRVYLASQYFRLGADAAAGQATVREIVLDLLDNGCNLVACYRSTRLAVNGRTGAVLSQFPMPK
jgi:hypothetical protein